jgi:hypothetical protein
VIDVVLICLSHILNWFGLHIFKLGVVDSVQFPVILLIGYFFTAVTSSGLLFINERRSIVKVLRFISGKTLILALLWVICLASIYYIFIFNSSVTQSFVFISQACAPVLVGLIYTYMGTEGFSKYVYLVIVSLILLGFERGHSQLSGNYFVFIMLLSFFMGTQYSVRELLKKFTSLECSVLLSVLFVALLIVYCLIVIDLKVVLTVSIFVRGIAFGLVLCVVQIIFLTVYKRGNVLVTSLAQSSSILFGMVMDHLFYKSSFGVYATAIVLAYMLACYRVALFEVKKSIVLKDLD